MARYGADQNKVIGVHESGAYANPVYSGTAMVGGSAFWLGQVTDHSIDDAEGLIENRYMGTSNRTFASYDQGPQDVTGTLTLHPVDMRLAFWAIGSVEDVSGATATTCTHAVQEIDSDVCQNFFVSGTGQDMTVPMCFTIEDSKQAPGANRNFIRNVKGCVLNTVTIAASQGEKVTVDVDYIAQSVVYTPSGTTTTIIDSGTTPYMWSDCTLTLAGSPMDTAKAFSLAIAKNMIVDHYIGSSTLSKTYGRLIAPPVEGNRDYTLSLTMDLPSDDAFWIYDTMYKGGSTFNTTWDLDSDAVGQVGSRHAFFAMSGCQIISMDNPSTTEGLNETTLEIKPQHITGSAWDTISNYNPW